MTYFTPPISPCPSQPFNPLLLQLFFLTYPGATVHRLLLQASLLSISVAKFGALLLL